MHLVTPVLLEPVYDHVYLIVGRLMGLACDCLFGMRGERLDQLPQADKPVSVPGDF